MENQERSHLSENPAQSFNSNSGDASEEWKYTNSEVVVLTNQDSETDSGYSSDVDYFQSPMDSMAHQETSISLKAFKNEVDSDLKELFATSNLDEFIFCIEQLGNSMFVYEVIARSITMAADRDDKERELISRLMSLGYGRIFSTFSITRGFHKLFRRISDSILDCPDMEDILSKFLARAIADEVVPPAILSDPVLTQNGPEVLKKTESILNMPHSLEMIEHIWGPRAGVLGELTATRSFIIDTIREFYDSHDMNECIRCIAQLKVPFYMHEFVKKTMEIAMDDVKRIPFAEQVIEKACKEDVVPHHQLLLGIKRLYKGLSDLILDVPHAKQYIDDMKSYFIKEELITEEELSFCVYENKHNRI